MQCEIEIDGSVGGGSVLRVAIPLALGLNKSIRIFNIRANRPKPGLRNQHLIGLQALAEITSSSLKNAHVGSTDVQFYPTQDAEWLHQLTLVVETAASISLIIQILSNFSFVTRHDIKAVFEGGGTHTNWSPSLEYIQNVTHKVFLKFGQNIATSIDTVGFYPKGGARISVDIKTNTQLAKVQLDKSSVASIQMYLTASRQLIKSQVLERQLLSFEQEASQEIKFAQSTQYVDSLSIGTSALVVINYKNGFAKGISILGQKGMSSEKIGKKLAAELHAEMGHRTVVDQYMADQLIIPLLFSEVGSYYAIGTITEHVKTNLMIVREIMGPMLEIDETAQLIKITRI